MNHQPESGFKRLEELAPMNQRSEFAGMTDAELQAAMLGCLSPSASGKAEASFGRLQAIQEELARREERSAQGTGNRHARRARMTEQRRAR